MSINKKLSTTYPRYVDYFMLSDTVSKVSHESACRNSWPTLGTLSLNINLLVLYIDYAIQHIVFIIQ